MQNAIRFLALAISALVLSACAVAPTGAEFSPATRSDPNSALVYVYREPGLVYGGRPAYFYINGTNVFDLSPGGYSWVALPPGQYKIKQAWPADLMKKSMEADLAVSAGETRFLSFATGVCDKYVYNGICINWTLIEQPQQSALASLRTKRLQDNFGAAKLKEALDTP